MSTFFSWIKFLNDEIVTSAKTSFDIFLGLLPTIVLWVGIMKIVSNSGLLNKISKFVYLTPILFYPKTLIFDV